MDVLEKALQESSGTARTIGEILREVCRISPQAAALVGQDLANPALSLEKCAGALKDYARKHQSGGCWSCAVFGIGPENEAVKVILDFYHIPPEWLGGGAASPAKASPAPGGKIDLMGLL